MSKKDKYFHLQYLKEGGYYGVIDSYDIRSTQDGSTEFLNLTILVSVDDDEIPVCKSFITNFGRNHKLRTFLQDMNVKMKKGNRVDFDDLLDKTVSFDLSYDDNGKIVIENIQEDCDFSDENEDDHNTSALYDEDEEE